MEYYPSFIKENENDNFGILSFDNGNFCVNNKIVENNRGIVGDEVFIRNEKVINVKTRRKHIIPGVLCLSSRVKYGFNKRGIPMYIFKPYDRKYPAFKVCSKTRSRKNEYVIIEFNSWDSDSKYPRGYIVKKIGITGLIESEYEYILSQLGLDYKRWNERKGELKGKIFEDLKDESSLQEGINEYDVISIDPLGCKDIDDAFHFLKINDNEYEVGIHIADVVYYLNDFIEEGIKNRFFTIYTPTSRKNMIPDIYSNNICSLIEGRNRRAVSTIFKYNIDDDGNIRIIDINFKRSIIHNKKAFDYEYVDKIFRRNKCKDENERMVYDLRKFMETILGMENINSHNLIEYFMIKTNNEVGKKLYEWYGEKMIFRKHDKSNFDDTIEDEVLSKFLKLRRMKKAKYCFSDKEGNNFHYGLNLNNYTHFTSPIRRYNDIIIHKLLLDKLYDCCNNISVTQELLDNMNNVDKKINKSERMIRRIEVIKELEDRKMNSAIYTDGYVIKIFDKGVKVYIPEFKLEEKIFIVPRKLEEVIDINWNEKVIEWKCSNNEDSIIMENKLELFQKVNLEIFPFLREERYWDKIRIKLLK